MTTFSEYMDAIGYSKNTIKNVSSYVRRIADTLTEEEIRTMSVDDIASIVSGRKIIPGVYRRNYSNAVHIYLDYLNKVAE